MLHLSNVTGRSIDIQQNGLTDMKSTDVIIDKELAELWSLTEDWIDDVKRKTHRSSCRIGTTIQFKNDQKRVDETWKLIYGDGGLEELALELHAESGLLDKIRSEFEEKMKNEKEVEK